mmetsp:Transcript_10215/g.37845  ORF Transcript_10215/g.37845 Transcript_10215/m.37845 type:complete len:85 (+) Transcript_10215:876-1130(+)
MRCSGTGTRARRRRTRFENEKDERRKSGDATHGVGTRQIDLARQASARKNKNLISAIERHRITNISYPTRKAGDVEQMRWRNKY